MPIGPITPASRKEIRPLRAYRTVKKPVEKPEAQKTAEQPKRKEPIILHRVMMQAHARLV